MFEIPEYDPSSRTFHDKDAVMTDSWVNLKISGDLHPKWRQVWSLHQKEVEIKFITAKCSDTSAKLQDLYAVLYNGTLLAELSCLTITTYLNVYLMNSEMRDKAGVAKRMRIVTTQMGVRQMIHPSLTKRYKTNDRQLWYRRLSVTIFTDTTYSTILSRKQNKAAQVFCTDFGFVKPSQ
jgi:hypothetical protein